MECLNKDAQKKKDRSCTLWVGRDKYNSLTSAKLPPKNGDGQLKSTCVDKKADKIYILIEKIICIIRTMAALEVMITLHPRVVVKVAEVT